MLLSYTLKHLTQILFLAIFVGAIPKRGNFPWTIVLCKFRDQPHEPKPNSWFQSWLTDEKNQGSILRYFGEVSNGLYTIYDSNVVGWYLLPYTKADVYSLAWSDAELSDLKDPKLKVFYKIKDLCLTEAKKNNNVVHKNTISVINDEETAVFCKENGVLLTPKFFLSSALAHEMTHSFFIGHSYSDKPVKIFPYSSLGEYDDKYDLMSTANAYMFKSPYGMAGPGLNGPHLDFLGWLPKNRVYYFGTKGHKQEIRRLASLSTPHGETTDLLLILVPYDRDDPQNVFTVEFRTPTWNDRGIRKPAVVIHKIKRTGKHYYSYLVTPKNNSYALEEGMSWRLNYDRYQYLDIKVLAIDARFNIADVDIINRFSPTNCRIDEVRRRITQTDPVCVSPKEKLKIEESTRNRLRNQDSDGNCLPGLVKRNFKVTNHVCVTPAQREKHRLENVQYYHRKNFYKNLHTWGLNACKKGIFHELRNGYVWREIDPYDYACLPPASRQAAKRQNAVSWRHKNGTDGCLKGFVRRNAFSRDGVCVEISEYSQVQLENNDSKNWYKFYGFFNGVDSVE